MKALASRGGYLHKDQVKDCVIYYCIIIVVIVIIIYLSLPRNDILETTMA